MVLLALFCVAIGVAKAFPHLPVGRALRGVLIEQPARFLMTLTPPKILGMAVLIASVVALAPALPAEMAFLAASDAALYVEVLAAAAALAVRTAGLRIVSRHVTRIRQAIGHAVAPTRRAATGRKHRRPVAGGPDEEEPELAFA